MSLFGVTSLCLSHLSYIARLIPRIQPVSAGTERNAGDGLELPYTPRLFFRSLRVLVGPGAAGGLMMGGAHRAPCTGGCSVGGRSPSQPPGSRLRWSLVIPAKTYTVVSNSFSSPSAGTGTLCLVTLPPSSRRPTYLEHANSFVKFAKAKGGAPRTRLEQPYPTLVRARYQNTRS